MEQQRIFLGWSTNSAATTAQYTPGDEFTIAVPTNVYNPDVPDPIGGFVNTEYYSSEQQTGNYSWTVYFANGNYSGAKAKYFSCRVRRVRAFE